MNLDEMFASLKQKKYFGDHMSEKPPMGLMPKDLHEEKRMTEIREAIERYLEAGKKIHIAWVEEYDELLEIYYKRKETRRMDYISEPFGDGPPYNENQVAYNCPNCKSLDGNPVIENGEVVEYFCPDCGLKFSYRMKFTLEKDERLFESIPRSERRMECPRCNKYTLYEHIDLEGVCIARYCDNCDFKEGDV